MAVTTAQGFFDFTGRTVFVSGAGNVGQGIGNGKAVALVLARRGARVFAVDIVPEAVAETARLIRAEGGEVETHVADATQSDQVAAALEACVQRFGGLDILVNNVGGSAPGGAAEMTPEQWASQIDFNLTSAYLGCHHAIPHLLRQGGGVIVNIASIMGLRMSAERPHIGYSAAKQGLIGLSKSVAVQHARNGIRCNTVVPGLINTPLVETRIAKQMSASNLQAFMAKRHAQVPMGQMGSCWDVANAVMFLSSHEAGHITGTELVVDGGMSAALPA